MRILSPIKAISHALNSVVTYRQAALRIGMFWIPVLFLIGFIEMLTGSPPSENPELGRIQIMQVVSAAVGLVAVSSMAVSWHRFILRDELGPPSRIDANVVRYAGNFLMIMFMVLVPMVAIAIVLAFLPPAASIVLVPIGLLAGAAAARLSIKLPAVALGRKDFSFRDAWRASEGNFLQLLGVFLLNTAIFLAALLLLIVAVSGLGQISPVLSQVAALILGAAVQLFYTVFNASIFTSLYGFFVERRDF